ncbi:leucine-rich repeat flightless-interacting protein 2 isoform X3 [Aethina tumida]|uniref:leucine-rich repeat flightless-interacting protein 2 isoform X3 n=1 Tax=Aethina tumida TaxID=116153 RepID=UPI00096AE87C|nr:leucine-rich repeat flightless-interacting protein 2 isoform X3 [Aethina tumida]
MDKGENEGRQGVAVAADEADNSDNDKHSDDSLECDRLRTKDSHSDNSNSDYCDSLDGSDGVPKVKGSSELNNNLVQLDGVTCTESSDHVETLSSHQVHHEDIIAHILQKENDNAEARLFAKRQARAEAREIRMRELERQQKEQEENADRQFDMLAASDPVGAAGARIAASRPAVVGAGAAVVANHRYLSSRRSSEDSLEDGGGATLRDIRNEMKELEEKFRKAMIANAQLDNDKSAQTYQLELLKDRLEELEEEHSQLRREHRDKCREHEQLKRVCGKLKDDLAVTRYELEERDRLIAEKGLVIVGEDSPPDEEGATTPRKALVTAENAQLLREAGDGSLDVRLERFAKEKTELQDQISHLKLELEEERSKRRKSSAAGSLNGPLSDYDTDDLQREASKQLADWKFRAQKAEQDVATLQATVARLESQVIRYKTAAEISEQSEEALKSEKRKLQREVNKLNELLQLKEATNEALLRQQKRLMNRRESTGVQ